MINKSMQNTRKLAKYHLETEILIHYWPQKKTRYSIFKIDCVLSQNFCTSSGNSNPILLLSNSFNILNDDFKILYLSKEQNNHFFCS